MHVRVLALALLPALGAACAHTARSEGSAATQQTQTTDRSATAQQGQAEPDRTTGSPAAPPSDQNRTSSGAASDTASGSASAGDVARDPLMEPGDAAKGHADDQLVSGTIARVSRRAIVIDSDTGDQRTLFLAPETSIQVDGQDAARTELHEGQEVRASFSEVEGREIAVEIHAGQDAASGSGAATSTDSSTTDRSTTQPAPAPGPGASDRTYRR